MSDTWLLAAGDDPHEGLRAVRAVRELADRLEYLQVERARGSAGPGRRLPMRSV